MSTIIHQTEAALRQACAEAPQDAAPRLALADWYDENGRPDEAEACRWIAAKRRRPIAYTPGLYSLYSVTQLGGPRGADDLPFFMVRHLKGGHIKDSISVAYLEVADGLDAIVSAWKRLGRRQRAAAWAWEPPV